MPTYNYEPMGYYDHPYMPVISQALPVYAGVGHSGFKTSFGTGGRSVQDAFGNKAYQDAVTKQAYRRYTDFQRGINQYIAMIRRFGGEPDQAYIDKQVQSFFGGAMPQFARGGSTSHVVGEGRNKTYSIPVETSPGGLKTTRRMGLNDMIAEQEDRNRMADATNRQGDEELRRQDRESQILSRQSRSEDRNKALELAEIRLRQSGAVAKARVDISRMSSEDRIATAKVAQLADEHPDPAVKAQAGKALQLVKNGASPQQALASIEAGVQVEREKVDRAERAASTRQERSIQVRQAIADGNSLAQVEQTLSELRREEAALANVQPGQGGWTQGGIDKYRAAVTGDIALAEQKMASLLGQSAPSDHTVPTPGGTVNYLDWK